MNKWHLTIIFIMTILVGLIVGDKQGKKNADKWWEQQAIKSHGAWCWSDVQGMQAGGISGAHDAYRFGNGWGSMFCQATGGEYK
jgi:hypothetical protein